ncbi:restriction endonuclease subunit S [Pseudidiomarina sp. WS423]|uniref:restriction endonuclease subunit S n=1 Tax=Pseudidiomarina sp. WS423 TaxID=3425124 RepID=UPI003D6F8DB8
MSKAMKGEKQALVPRLRFPEFREAGEWEIKSLGDVCSVLQGYGFPTDMQGKLDGEYPFCKVSDVSKAVAENGGHLDDAANYVGKQELSKLRAKLIPVGSTVFAKIGEALRLNRRAYVSRECLIDNNVVGLKAADGSADDYFIYISSQLIDLNEHCGGAVPSVNKTTLEAVEVVVPSLDEQQKIADCLSSLDALIAAQADKIDALKNHKKGLMQQLLPREGETVPRLRFPEFRDAGEWELSQLGEKVKLLSGFPFKSQDISEDSSGIPLMRGINITEGYIRHNRDIDRFYLGDVEQLQKYRLKVNDLVIGMDGSKVGKNSAVVTEKDAGSLLIQRVARLRTECIFTIQFIFQHIHSSKFHSYVDRINTSGGIPHISAKQINEFEICFPPTKQEQQKIADCLSSVDEALAAHTKKLEALKTQKKGLMQQLFPNPQAVSI